jgi:ubiquinone/menaquinone biosynthesis C-methylase UbiE
MNELERVHVRDVYNEIAESFDNTRYSVWKCVKNFIDGLDKNSEILDVGCGNGKNMKYMVDNGFVNVHGCDFSSKLVQICKGKQLDVIEANILSLPYQDKSFDNVICVAVLHHLSTRLNRTCAINELVRVTKSEGHIFISVNSTSEFNKSSRHIETKNDLMIGWQNKTERFYHLFEEGELEELCNINPSIEYVHNGTECGNYYLILRVK